MIKLNITHKYLLRYLSAWWTSITGAWSSWIRKDNTHVVGNVCFHHIYCWLFIQWQIHEKSLDSTTILRLLVSSISLYQESHQVDSPSCLQGTRRHQMPEWWTTNCWAASLLRHLGWNWHFSCITTFLGWLQWAFI